MRAAARVVSAEATDLQRLGDLAKPGERDRTQRRLLLLRRKQDAQAGHRREGHADLKLGVVLGAQLLVEVRPAVVKDELAIRVAL